MRTDRRCAAGVEEIDTSLQCHLPVKRGQLHRLVRAGRKHACQATHLADRGRGDQQQGRCRHAGQAARDRHVDHGVQTGGNLQRRGAEAGLEVVGAQHADHAVERSVALQQGWQQAKRIAVLAVDRVVAAERSSGHAFFHHVPVGAERQTHHAGPAFPGAVAARIVAAGQRHRAVGVGVAEAEQAFHGVPMRSRRLACGIARNGTSPGWMTPGRHGAGFTGRPPSCGRSAARGARRAISRRAPAPGFRCRGRLPSGLRPSARGRRAPRPAR